MMALLNILIGENPGTGPSTYFVALATSRILVTTGPLCWFVALNYTVQLAMEAGRGEDSKNVMSQFSPWLCPYVHI